MNNTTTKTKRVKMNWKAEAERACKSSREAWEALAEAREELKETFVLCERATIAINSQKAKLIESEKEATELGNQLFDMTDQNAVLRADSEKSRRENGRLCEMIHHLHAAIGALIHKTEG